MIHPGKIIEKKINELGMSQKELAIRTEVTEKHVWTIINGKRDISFAYAKKLEYVFPDVEAGYFYKLQLDYDLEKHNQETENNITEEEKEIFKQLKEAIGYIIARGQEFINESMNEVEQILGLRKFLGFSNLNNIKISTDKIAYRMSKSSNITVNPYVTYMWIRICEYYGEKEFCNKKLDKDKLVKKIPDIKKMMLQDDKESRVELKKIFADCGIVFIVVPNFKGAPSQGFIKMLPNDSALLCLTIRGKRVDTFWFTLFHEIAHIINGDVDKKFVDIKGDINDKEKKADECAANYIIDLKAYKEFIYAGDYSLNSINQFAKKQNIPNYMVIGRLQNENILSFSDYQKFIPHYEWCKKNT